MLFFSRSKCKYNNITFFLWNDWAAATAFGVVPGRGRAATTSLTRGKNCSTVKTL